MYDDGTGVEQNYFEAVKWYRLAADQGNASAQATWEIASKKALG
jgi:TPR repeat protein